MTIREIFQKYGIIDRQAANRLFKKGGKAAFRLAIQEREIDVVRIGHISLVRKDEVLAWKAKREARVVDMRNPAVKKETYSLLKAMDLNKVDLSERQRLVLRMRYGLSGRRQHSMGQIAHILGLSDSRIHQLEKAGVEKVHNAMWVKIHTVLGAQ